MTERGHDHGHALVGTTDALARSRTRRLSIAIGLNAVIVVAQVAFGVVAHSVALFADAGHNFADAGAAVLALVAVRWTLRRPTAARSFGYHRGTVLAAQANGAAILAITLLVGIESVRRLADPGTVHGGVVLVVALVAAAVDGIAALVLHEHGGHDVNMRAVTLHAVGDALASLAVAVAGAVIFVTGGNEWLDPAASLVVCAVIAVQGWRLLRETTDVLLESTPSNVDVDALTDAIAAVSGVESVHDLHVWSLSSDVRALSAHLVLAGHPTLEEAQVVGERVKATIGPTYSIAHATLELECEACADVGPWCAMDGDTTDAVAAGRTAGP